MVEKVNLIQSENDKSSAGANAFVGALIWGPVGAYIGANMNSNNEDCNLILRSQSGERYFFNYASYQNGLVQRCSQLKEKEGNNIIVRKFSSGGVSWIDGYTEYPARLD